MARSETSLAESVCLALVVTGVDYGGAIADLLAPGAEFGRIWTLSKPLTYRAIDALIAAGRLERRGTAPGRGRERSLLHATRTGRAATRVWIAEPVAHLRDVRTALLLKFQMLERMGESLVPLALCQREAFAPRIEALTADLPADVVGRWRVEHARAVEELLDAIIGDRR